ncbi:MAG: hypothetical protein WD904_14590 [Dehalococcoidia bacterium]
MRPPWPAIVLAAAVSLIVVGCGDSDDDEDPPETTPDHISLQGVDDEFLDGIGMTLEPPTESDSPVITADEAEQTARDNGRAAEEVREVVLAHLHDMSETTEDGLLVWVVNFETEGEPPGMAGGPGPASTGEVELKLLVNFIDATTGDWLYAMESSGPVE